MLTSVRGVGAHYFEMKTSLSEYSRNVDLNPSYAEDSSDYLEPCLDRHVLSVDSVALDWAPDYQI